MKRRERGFRTYENRVNDKAYIRLESRLVRRGLSDFASICIALAASDYYYPVPSASAFANERSKRLAHEASKSGWILAKDYPKGRITSKQVYDVLGLDEDGSMDISTDTSAAIKGRLTLCRMWKRFGRGMVAQDSRTDTFTVFVALHEVRLRQSLVAACGGEIGRDAAAEAWEYAWANWERVRDPDPYSITASQHRIRNKRRQRNPIRSPIHPTNTTPDLPAHMCRYGRV